MPKETLSITVKRIRSDFQSVIVALEVAQVSSFP